MFAIGGTFVEGTTAPGAAVAHKTADGEEVDKVVAGDKSQTREGVTGIPGVGGAFNDVLTSAEHSAGTHAGAINQAANSDPTVSTGSGSGSGSGSTTGGTDGGTAPAGTGTPSGGEDNSQVIEEHDNPDGGHVTTYDDGTIITTYDNGTQIVDEPDVDSDGKPTGTSTTTIYDGVTGDTTTVYADGSTYTIHKDGSVSGTDETSPQYDPNATDTSGTDSSGSDTSGSDTSGSGSTSGSTSGSGSGSGTDTSGSGSGSGSGTSGTDATSAKAGGGDPGGGDPGDPDTGAPLPGVIQQQLDADIAAVRALHPVQGDGFTDPNPDAGEPVDETGPIPDTKGKLLGGDPGNPEWADFGSGAHGDVGSLAGSVGGLDPRTSDPSPEADTGVQTEGPSERHVQQPTPSLGAAPTGAADTSSDTSSSDSAGVQAVSAVSPLHGLLHTDLVPDRLAAADDASDDSGDDADD
jgi:hypothetical protein